MHSIPGQARYDTRLIEHELGTTQPGFISLIVLVELCWVLKRLYAATEGELTHTVSFDQDALRWAGMTLLV